MTNLLKRKQARSSRAKHQWLRRSPFAFCRSARRLGKLRHKSLASQVSFTSATQQRGDYATSPWHWAVAAAKRNAKKEKRKTHPELYARLWFRQPPPAAGFRRILVSGGTKTRIRPDVPPDACGPCAIPAPGRRTNNSGPSRRETRIIRYAGAKTRNNGKRYAALPWMVPLTERQGLLLQKCAALGKMRNSTNLVRNLYETCHKNKRNCETHHFLMNKS